MEQSSSHTYFPITPLEVEPNVDVDFNPLRSFTEQMGKSTCSNLNM